VPGNAIVDTLGQLRSEIDDIDARMHGLLIQRGEIIDRLISVKSRQGGGSAFRPSREASMMRSLALRHAGVLPFETVEGIWRTIISTFTFVQSPYRVHVDLSSGEAAMRDSARFHFGFTVPCVPHDSTARTIDAVRHAAGDLGMFAVEMGSGPWWSQLTVPTAPKIIARLPFVERANHPAGTPVFVVAKPIADGGAREILLESVSVDRWRPLYTDVVRSLSAEIISSAAEGSGLSLLVARPGVLGADEVPAALRDVGARDLRIVEVGAHAARFESSAAK
jgi:chorismate mutase